MLTTRHMCADIRGMLNNHRRKGSLKNVFKDENGRGVSDEAARDYLYDCLAKGWQVIPMGDCDNFDYQTGCQGHSENTEIKVYVCPKCKESFPSVSNSAPPEDGELCVSCYCEEMS